MSAFDYRFAFAPGNRVTSVTESGRDIESESSRRVGIIHSCRVSIRVSIIDHYYRVDFQVRFGADDLQWIEQSKLVAYSAPSGNPTEAEPAKG